MKGRGFCHIWRSGVGVARGINTNEVGWGKTKHIVAEQEAQCLDKKSEYDSFFDFFGCLIFTFRERAEFIFRTSCEIKQI